MLLLAGVNQVLIQSPYPSNTLVFRWNQHIFFLFVVGLLLVAVISVPLYVRNLEITITENLQLQGSWESSVIFRSRNTTVSHDVKKPSIYVGNVFVLNGQINIKIFNGVFSFL